MFETGKFAENWRRTFSIKIEPPDRVFQTDKFIKTFGGAVEI